MGIFGNKRAGFTLAEILVTLGLIGVISSMTIPTLAYNYKSRVLEQQFRATYSEIMQLTSMMSRNGGDIGTMANSTSINSWASTFMSNMTGYSMIDKTERNGQSSTKLIRNRYINASTPPGPYRFYPKEQIDMVCDDGSLWTDAKGRIWSFNKVQSAVCVDVNGVAAPNRYNMDIFVFVPMTSQQVATWLYDDPEHPRNYSGQMVLCDIEHMANYKLYYVTAEEKENKKGAGSILDSCPFNEPLENVAPLDKGKDGTPKDAGTAANGKITTLKDNYWTTYINYR